ncbi:MAG: T9SS type A sorting domain-containing protein [bacterium]
MPFVLTSQVAVAKQHAVIVLTSKTKRATLDAAEKTELKAYVETGGVLVAPNVRDRELYALFGISDQQWAETRHSMTWDMSLNDPALSYFDNPLEQTISFGEMTQSTVITTRSYELDGATALAYFDDGSAAVTRHDYGAGRAYALGFSFSDLIVRNQTDNDYRAERTYSNGFEPTSDVVILFLRGIYTSQVPFASWKHTSPYASQATLIVTHDVDSQSGMDMLSEFANLESQHGIVATYNITTHYMHDKIGKDFYTPNLAQIAGLIAKNQKLASHTVGHFPDWPDEDIFPEGETGLTRETYQPAYDGKTTRGGNVFGEIEVSKNLLEGDFGVVVRTFRTGFLFWNKKQAAVLDSVGYDYDSSRSANDVLTNFPYLLRQNNSFSGKTTNIYEIPNTISDVFMSDPISADNYPSKVAIWYDVILSNAANYAPTVLLIHPNRDFKLLAEEQLLNELPQDILVVDMDTFGDFWRDRVAFTYQSSLANDVLTITIPEENLPVNDMLSIVVDHGRKLAGLVVQKDNGEPVSFWSSSFKSDDLILTLTNVVSSVAAFAAPRNNDSVLFPTSPNPFNATTVIRYRLQRSGEVRLSVFNLLGQEILILEDGQKSAGDHSAVVDMRAFPSGMYLYRLQTRRVSRTRSMILMK